MPDLLTIVQTVGLIGLFLIIFAESGLFFGFFFPGDSLLFSAGLVASNGLLNIWALVIGCIIAAILGDSVGYFTGKYMAIKLFSKDRGFIFKKKRLDDAEVFYKKHGAITIIIARFVPLIRTFAPIAAGMGKMKYKMFVIYNILGGVFWVLLLALSGYFLGKNIQNPDKYILPIVGGIAFLSILPILYRLISNIFKHR